VVVVFDLWRRWGEYWLLDGLARKLGLNSNVQDGKDGRDDGEGRDDERGLDDEEAREDEEFLQDSLAPMKTGVQD